MIEGAVTSSLKVSSTVTGGVVAADPSGGEDETSEAWAAAGVAVSPAITAAISAVATSGKSRQHRAARGESLTTCLTHRSSMNTVTAAYA